MTRLRQAWCWIVGHRYRVMRVFSPTDRQVVCRRCRQVWGMNDSVRALVPWSGEIEQMYRDCGQWPGEER